MKEKRQITPMENDHLQVKEQTLKTINKRVFLFGCSRSGTTLLQVLLARHPSIYSLPETFFFDLTITNRRKLLAQLNLSTGKEKKGLMETSEILGLNPNQLPYKKSVLYEPTVNTFIKFLDKNAVDNGKSIWLEKTPYHINYINIINKYVCNVHFVHIIRNGTDTVASIVDRAYKHDPRLFSEQQKDPTFGIRKWNNAIKISLKYLGNCEHSFVSYESLTREPDTVLMKLCKELNIEYLPSIKNPESNQPKNDLTKHPHLQNSSHSIKPIASKFGKLFDQKTKFDIIRNLDWKSYHVIKQYIDDDLSNFHSKTICS